MGPDALADALALHTFYQPSQNINIPVLRPPVLNVLVNKIAMYIHVTGLNA